MARKIRSNGSVMMPKDPVKVEQWLKSEAERIFAAEETAQEQEGGCSGVGIGYQMIRRDLMPDQQPIAAKASEILEEISDRLRSFFDIPEPRLQPRLH